MTIKVPMSGGEKALIALSVTLSVALAFFFECHQIVSGDQMQMLIKGYHAAMTGEYIPYGNEASTVGNVPGSLSSLVVGFPLTLWLHPLAPIILLVLLRTVGVLLFANTLAQLFSNRTVVAGTAIYALNPWYMYDFLIYNPSYLSFGAALFLNMLVRLRSSHDISGLTRFACSLLLALACGFCLQFHFSWPVLVALSGVLWLRCEIKISYVGIILGVALVGVSLIPYLNEVLQNTAIRTNSADYTDERYFGYGLVHVYPLFKAVLYWLRFGSLLVTQKALVADLPDAAPLYQEILRYLWIGITQVVGVVTVIVSAFINYQLIFRMKHDSDPSIRFVRGLTISCLIGLLVAAGAATLVLNYWQIIILFAFALMPVMAAVDNNSLWTYRHLLLLMAVMVVFNVVSACGSDKFSWDSSYIDAVNEYCVNTYGAGACALPSEAD